MGRLTRFAMSSLRVVGHRCSHLVILVVTWYGPHHEPCHVFDPLLVVDVVTWVVSDVIRVVTKWSRVATGVVKVSSRLVVGVVKVSSPMVFRVVKMSLPLVITVVQRSWKVVTWAKKLPKSSLVVSLAHQKLLRGKVACLAVQFHSMFGQCHLCLLDVVYVCWINFIFHWIWVVAVGKDCESNP